MLNTEEKKRKKRLEYFRKWRKENPEKPLEYQRRYWKKKLEKEAKQNEVNR